MKAQALGLACLLAFLALPAGAQSILDSTGRLEPAQRAELLFAARVTRAVALPLERTSRLVQPAGKPRALAGHVLRGVGERVELSGLTVRRLRFATPQAAAVAAGLLGRTARVDTGQPRFVTQATGPRASPKVLALVESRTTNAQLPADLAKTLTSTETSRGADACQLTVPRPAVGFRGVAVHLEGLSVFRLSFSTEAEAARFTEQRAATVTAQLVLDQVGSELVLLSGSGLFKERVARKALLAAWKFGRPARGKHTTIGVWTSRAFAVFCAVDGKLYQRGADLIRRYRKAPKGLTSAGIEWRFTDPKTRNDLRLRPKIVLPKATPRYGGVLATPGGLLHVSGPTRAAPERRFLLELLSAVGFRLPPPGTKRVRLFDPR